MRFLLGRLAFSPVVLVVVAVITFLVPRGLRPERYRGQELWPGVWSDLERTFGHLDLGVACGWPGCPPIHDMWMSGAAADLWLLAGALAFGVGAGVGAGMWCATHPRSTWARWLETAASVVYCTPVYVMGLLLLLAFHPKFGALPLPVFFDADPNWAQPWQDPVTWFTTLLVPWLVVGAPLAAMCLRLTLNMTVEALDEDYVRTARAKGISHRRTVRRHAGPASYLTTASFLAVSVPLVVANMVLVERVLSVPGFFRHTWRAVGHTQSALDRAMCRNCTPTDYPMLQAITLWGAVLVIASSLLVDVALLRLDPRIRTDR